MARVGRRARLVLRTMHMLFPAIWLGAGLCLALMLTRGNYGLGESLALWATAKTIDVILVAIPNLLTLLTGLLLCWLTPWGLRHRWILLKLAINTGVLLYGGFTLRHVMDRALAVLQSGSPVALSDPVFVHSQSTLLAAIAVVEVLLVLAFLVSVFKPWGARGALARAHSNLE